MDKKRHVDWGNPNIFVIIILAFVTDALIIFFPLHYALALFAGAMIFPSLQGFFSRALFLIGAILPLPFFGILMVAAILLTNSKVARFIFSAAKEIAIQVAAVALSESGIGEAIEAARAGKVLKTIKATGKAVKTIKEGGKIVSAGEKTAKIARGVTKTEKAVGRTRDIAGTISKDSTGKIRKAVVDETKRYLKEEALEDWDEQTQQDLFNDMPDEDMEQMINDYLDGGLAEVT